MTTISYKIEIAHRALTPSRPLCHRDSIAIRAAKSLGAWD
jgi:hypothetical protein